MARNDIAAAVKRLRPGALARRMRMTLRKAGGADAEAVEAGTKAHFSKPTAARRRGALAERMRKMTR